jgi:hypothetical protein
MTGKLAILGTVKALSDIIDNLYGFYKDKREKRKHETEGIKVQSKEIFGEVSQLIDDFTETCDLIFHILAEFDEDRNYRLASTKILQANRRLFELSTEMRIIAKSLSNRLPAEVDIIELEQVTDACFQIILVENFIGVELISEHNFDLLPIDVSPRATRKVYGRLLHAGRMPNRGGFTLTQLNRALLELRSCKEKLAMALNEVV